MPTGVQKVKKSQTKQNHCEQECNRHYTLLLFFPSCLVIQRECYSSTQKCIFPTSRVNSVFAQNSCNPNMARDKGHAMGGKKIKPVLSKIRNRLLFRFSPTKTSKTEEAQRQKPLSPICKTLPCYRSQQKYIQTAESQLRH